MASVWESIKASIDADRLAHAYIIGGSPYGAGRDFAERMIRHLFCTSDHCVSGDCDTCTRIGHGTHPDVFCEQPKSMGRQIVTDQINALNRQIHQSAFEGGWKACMIIDAHRMNPVVSNKFLKTLEEPPERSLILLLTNKPEALLPTVVSRCQRIILPDTATRDEADWHEPVLGILRCGPPRDTLMLLTQAGSYRALFDEEKKKAETLVKAQFKEDETLDEDTLKALVASEYRRTWQEMFRFIECWYRDLYLLKSGAGAAGLHFNQEAAVLKKIAEDMSYTQARRRLELLPQMARRIDSNLPIQEVFEAGLAG